MLTVLEAINGIMDELGLDYEFEEWSGENTYPYWTMTFLGDYHGDESSRKEHYPILTGHMISEDDNWQPLWDQVQKIHRYFTPEATYVCEDGSVFHAKIQDIQAFQSQIPSHKTVDISLSARTWEVV